MRLHSKIIRKYRKCLLKATDTIYMFFLSWNNLYLIKDFKSILKLKLSLFEVLCIQNVSLLRYFDFLSIWVSQKKLHNFDMNKFGVLKFWISSCSFFYFQNGHIPDTRQKFVIFDMKTAITLVNIVFIIFLKNFQNEMNPSPYSNWNFGFSS